MTKPNHSKTLIAFFLAAFLCASCKKSEPMASGIIHKNMDTFVKPGDNFDAYVNGTWVKTNKIAADKSSAGAFDELLDKSQDNVKLIVESAAKAGGKQDSDEQKIGDFYGSYMDAKGREAKGVAPLQPIFAKIDAIVTARNLAAYFGEVNRLGGQIPFQVNATEDFKDPTKYMLFTWQGGIGLPEREYYTAADAKSEDIRKKYVAHIENMLKLAGFPDAAAKASRIMALETQIATQHMKKEDTRNTAALYNPYKIKELGTLTPTFDWAAFFEAAKIPNEENIVIAQIAYMKAADGIIKNTPIDTWKDYLKWGAIHENATALNSALDKENFSFYGKILTGAETQRPQWRRAVDVLNRNMGEMVGKLYVEKYFPPEAKERMVKLVQNLLKAYEESIKKLDWMSEATKKEALKKISKFMIKIGYPDKWRDYSKLKIVKGDLYGNLGRSQEFEYFRQLNKLGKPVDKTEWGMSPQTVNAYYNPSFNEIVFPAAILQPPFFDMTADDAVNYGGIGGVIGHEIGHGFDDQGSTFDGDGAMKNWWTESDSKAFKEKTNALVEQYASFKIFPDLNANGAFTLGENIGDLGGLTIALKAYEMSLNGQKAPVLDGYTGEQRVFLGWAQVWLNKDREAALRNQVASDPHSPSRLRVNGVVRNIPQFYKAFNVKPGDSLYLPPEKRVKIW